MRTENYGVPRFDRHDAFKEDGGRGVRDRSKGKNDANRFRDFDESSLRKFVDRTHCAFIFDVVVDKLGGDHVLKGLVLENSEFGLLDRQPCQVLRMLQTGDDHRLDDAIDVLLCVLGEDGCGASRLAEQTLQVSDTIFAEAVRDREGSSAPLSRFGCEHPAPPLLKWGEALEFRKHSRLHFGAYKDEQSAPMTCSMKRYSVSSLLGVVDRMSFQLMLISDSTDTPQSSAGDTRGEIAALPSHA